MLLQSITDPNGNATTISYTTNPSSGDTNLIVTDQLAAYPEFKKQEADIPARLRQKTPFWRRGTMREAYSARGFPIQPELRSVDGVHGRLAARANPLVKAPSQSAAVAGRAGPLSSASFTHS